MVKLHTQSLIGDYPVALAAAHNLIAADPTDEQGYVDLVQLLLAHGQSSQARQQLERWKKIAREDLGIPVSLSLEELITEAERMQPSPVFACRSTAAPTDTSLAASLPVARSRFFGRDDKITDVLGLLRDEPMVRVVTISGTSGAGKTRLAGYGPPLQHRGSFSATK